MSATFSDTPHKPRQQKKNDAAKMLEYYGLDWALLTLGLTTKWLMIYQSRWAFVTSILGCLAGLAVAILAHQHGIALYNVILIGMSCAGFIRWGRLDARLRRYQQQPPIPQSPHPTASTY